MRKLVRHVNYIGCVLVFCMILYNGIKNCPRYASLKRPTTKPINLSIPAKFNLKWFKDRKPLCVNLNKNICGYYFPHEFLRTRTADQMVQMIGNSLIALETKRKLIIPKQFDKLNGKGFTKFKLLNGFEMFGNMIIHNLTIKQFSGNSNDSVLIENLDQLATVPCGTHVGFPKAMKVDEGMYKSFHRFISIGGPSDNNYYFDFEPSHYFLHHPNLEQDWFSKYIKRFAAFKPHILKQCKKRLLNGLGAAGCYNCKCALVVAHTRLTDYAQMGTKLSRLKLHTERLRSISVQYLAQAQRQIKTILNNTCTVLFFVSDDYHWTAKIAPKSGMVHVFETSAEPLVDLCLISSADAVILTLGNFGWLGAYLSDASVVTYQANQRMMYKPLSHWIPVQPCPYNRTKQQHYRECYPATMPFNHQIPAKFHKNG